MGLDINNTTLTQASGTLTINTGVTTSLTLAGALMRPNNALFSANGPGTWTYLTAGAWNKLSMPNVIINASNCYSGASARFTAPVDGKYAFQLALYLLKDEAPADRYFHPIFAVNGAMGGRTVNPSYPDYRLRGHGWGIAAYFWGNLSENYDLLAGDYVEPYSYSSYATNRWYPANSRFTGFMMG
jgi:hypothetical protein